MKIVHLCLANFFIDNYSYQENMLPKFHKQLGLDVEVIASLQSFDENGNACVLDNASVYLNEYDIKVTRLETRLKYKNPRKIYWKLKRFKGVYETLEKANPDIIFIHGCQFLDIKKMVKYLKKHKNVKVYVDNHADFSNSATNWFSKNILHKIIWRHCAHLIEPYTRKFYGVLPVRVDFLKNVYKLPPEKCELLVMGADDERVKEASSPEVKKQIRSQYGIKDDDFLIMTGGKIDPWKTQTLLLMEAVARIKNPKVKLIVFGSVTPDLKEEVESRCVKEKVQYVGWVQSQESYKYFASADLVVFPGRHSVFWEQVAAQGIPMLCKYWDGTTHVDIGGNVKFLKHDSADEIYEEISRLIENEDDYLAMKKVAKENGMKSFSYEDIAKRSIEFSVDNI